MGYGGTPVNVLRVGSRLILNGFHRVFALRSAGVTHVPVVVQDITNPQLEFPAQVAGLPREYLLAVARPVLMKDFFEADFTITLRTQDGLKVVNLGVACNEYPVPS